MRRGAFLQRFGKKVFFAAKYAAKYFPQEFDKSQEGPIPYWRESTSRKKAESSKMNLQNFPNFLRQNDPGDPWTLPDLARITNQQCSTLLAVKPWREHAQRRPWNENTRFET